MAKTRASQVDAGAVHARRRQKVRYPERTFSYLRRLRGYWAATCTVHQYANSRLSPAIDYAPLQTSCWIQARARGEQVMRRRTHGGTLAWVISIPSLEQEVGTITTGSHGPGHNYHRFPHLGNRSILAVDGTQTFTFALNM